MANAFVNKKVDLTSTDATTLYTVPSATTAVIKSIQMAKNFAKQKAMKALGLGALNPFL